jgi:hypothetical protein
MLHNTASANVLCDSPKPYQAEGCTHATHRRGGSGIASEKMVFRT